MADDRQPQSGDDVARAALQGPAECSELEDMARSFRARHKKELALEIIGVAKTEQRERTDVAAETADEIDKTMKLEQKLMLVEEQSADLRCRLADSQACEKRWRDELGVLQSQSASASSQPERMQVGDLQSLQEILDSATTGEARRTNPATFFRRSSPPGSSGSAVRRPRAGSLRPVEQDCGRSRQGATMTLSDGLRSIGFNTEVKHVEEEFKKSAQAEISRLEQELSEKSAALDEWIKAAAAQEAAADSKIVSLQEKLCQAMLAKQRLQEGGARDRRLQEARASDGAEAGGGAASTVQRQRQQRHLPREEAGSRGAAETMSGTAPRAQPLRQDVAVGDGTEVRTADGDSPSSSSKPAREQQSRAELQHSRDRAAYHETSSVPDALAPKRLPFSYDLLAMLGCPARQSAPGVSCQHVVWQVLLAVEGVLALRCSDHDFIIEDASKSACVTWGSSSLFGESIFRIVRGASQVEWLQQCLKASGRAAEAMSTEDALKTMDLGSEEFSDKAGASFNATVAVMHLPAEAFGRRPAACFVVLCPYPTTTSLGDLSRSGSVDTRVPQLHRGRW